MYIYIYIYCIIIYMCPTFVIQGCDYVVKVRLSPSHCNEI